jgi:hypothetical protein
MMTMNIRFDFCNLSNLSIIIHNQWDLARFRIRVAFSICVKIKGLETYSGANIGIKTYYGLRPPLSGLLIRRFLSR